MHELLFEIMYTLCKEFQALTPYEVEDRAFVDVIKLFADTRRMQIRRKKESDPNRIIMRPAGDSWF